MVTFAVIAAFLQAVLFQWWTLIYKRLMEKGMDKLGIFYYQRWAIIPGVLLVAASYRPEYMSFILAHPVVLVAILYSSMVWMSHVYLHMFATEATHSMAFLNAFNGLTNLPVYLLLGILINQDKPNGYILLALGLLVIALYIQPTPHVTNTRRTFHTQLFFLIGVSLLAHLIDAVNMAAYRYFMQELQAVFFGLAVSMFLAMLVVTVFFMGHRQYRRNFRQDLKTYSYWLFALPLIWVIGSIFEGYSIFQMPIYTLIAISSFTFLLDIASDMHNKRIHLNQRTILFIVLVLVSTVLSVISVY